MIYVLRSLSLLWDSWVEFLAPGFGLVHLRLLWAFGFLSLTLPPI